MSASDIVNIFNRAISEGLQFPWWLYILILLAPLIGGFLGSYLKKKAEDLATKKDYEELLSQLKQTTAATESIKSGLLRDNWVQQQKWILKEKYYSMILEEFYILKRSLVVRMDYYAPPGSEYLDDEISKNDDFKSQSQLGDNAINKIQQLYGAAAMVISQNAINALDQFDQSNYSAIDFFTHNSEYLETLYSATKEAYETILHEARSELR